MTKWNSQYDVFDSVFLFFRAYPTNGRHHSDAACPLQGSAQKPRRFSLRPLRERVINESHQLRRGALELGNPLKDVRTRVASSTLYISLQDCGYHFFFLFSLSFCPCCHFFFWFVVLGGNAFKIIRNKCEMSDSWNRETTSRNRFRLV